MVEVGSLLIFLSALLVCWLLARRIMRIPPPVFDRPAPLDTGPVEPCWTEEIASDGRFRYGRSQCVNAPLIELDARAQRRDFPITLPVE